MTGKSFIIPLALATLLVAGCGQNSGKAGSAASAEEAEEAVTKVAVQSASVEAVSHEEVYSTTVQAYAINNIVPQSGGRIKKINVEIGDYVYAGQVLAEMDRVALDQTRLKLVNDSTDLARIRELYQQGGVSQADFEAVELAYKVSKSNYDNLLENTILRSPITGVVTARNYDRGDMYAMAGPIYVVQQITPVKLIAGISESDYSKVHKGDKVTVTTDALPGRTFEGSIKRIYPTVDATTHTVSVEVVVPNEDRALRPGMYARAKVVFDVAKSVVVPDTAVLKQQGSGQKAVYLYDGGVARYTVVTVGRHFDGKYEILSGLTEGDQVIIKGNAGLKNGSKVEL